MLKPTDKVSLIPFVGPQYQSLLPNLNIYTVRNLLYHFPFRYDDYSKVKKISELMLDDTCTVIGIVESINNIFTKTGKKLTKLVLADDSGKITCIWFNQIYLAKSIPKGTNISICGKVTTFDNKLCFISPDFEVMKASGLLHSARLVPVYPETAGVSSKWLRSRINHLLNISKVNIEEYLPQSLIQKNKFKEINEALLAFHFPKDLDDAKEARKRFEYEELLEVLLKTETKRKEWNEKKSKKAFKSFENKIDDFIKSLPFELTKSQQNCIDEIIKDLEKEKPMNRLLQGDVGSGKTVIACIAAYLAFLNGEKTLYMAPTEVLATQHYETFNKLLSPYKVKIGITTGSKKSKEECDIEIGTHALLFKETDEVPGLIIIDEQHKFGVEQRSKMLNQNISPHLLTMTATPIPRTLSLTIYGDLDISTLTEKPIGRKNIQTKIVYKPQREAAYKWIRDHIVESKFKNQAYIVCPLIEESEHESLENVKAAKKEFENLAKGIFKDLKVSLLHGKMTPKEKEEVVKTFKEGKTHVLVSTPVIEVGIDVKNATVIAIEASERFGLASLHQIRGRVGRGDELSYCMLFTESDNAKVYSRLKHLEETNDGLKLAEYDLKLRGQGELFGTKQSGRLDLKLADITNVELVKKVKEDIKEVENQKKDFEDLKKYFVKEKRVEAN